MLSQSQINRSPWAGCRLGPTKADWSASWDPLPVAARRFPLLWPLLAPCPWRRGMRYRVSRADSPAGVTADLPAGRGSVFWHM